MQQPSLRVLRRVSKRDILLIQYIGSLLEGHREGLGRALYSVVGGRQGVGREPGSVPASGEGGR